MKSGAKIVFSVAGFVAIVTLFILSRRDNLPDTPRSFAPNSTQNVKTRTADSTRATTNPDSSIKSVETVPLSLQAASSIGTASVSDANLELMAGKSVVGERIVSNASIDGSRFSRDEAVAATALMVEAHSSLRRPRVADPDSEDNRIILDQMIRKSLAGVKQ